MVISIKIQNKFLVLDDETGFIVEIVSQNLAMMLNFIEFRDSQNFTFFKAPSSARHLAH